MSPSPISPSVLLSMSRHGYPAWRPVTLAMIVMTAIGSMICGDVSSGQADEETTIPLTLHPTRIDPSAPYPRLLPADPDLNGNAPVVLLRMPWEQQGWMQTWLPRLEELARLPPGDPDVAEFPFDRFAHEMGRAASMSTADWAYPLEDEPAGSIPLPDLQGLRNFIGRGMLI